MEKERKGNYIYGNEFRLHDLKWELFVPKLSALLKFEEIDTFIEQNGLKRKYLLHREVYINDPGKTVEEK
ncbi:MAG: hypothetical protein PHY44_00330 [Lachnospiraceae bacterium]|nr:hypothetical protein [Lachnospiraceae bacterium]